MPVIKDATAPTMLIHPRMKTPFLRSTQQQHFDTMMTVDGALGAPKQCKIQTLFLNFSIMKIFKCFLVELWSIASLATKIFLK